MREITVNEKVYLYRVGSSFMVMQTPDGSKRFYRLDLVTSRHFNDIAYDQMKKSFHLTPQDVKDFILREKL